MAQYKDVTIITKGDRVKATWLKVKPPSGWPLAGVQTKFPASSESVTGTIRHLRTNSREDQLLAFLDADEPWDGPLAKPPGCLCATGHVPVRAEWIVEKLLKKDS